MNDVFAQGIREHMQVIEWLKDNQAVLHRIAGLLIGTLSSGRRVYLAGNGGSAADAQHIAAELVGRFKHPRQALPAIAMTTDTSVLLSIGNDFGFEEVFARQVEALVNPGDVFWALSTSGNSPNVVAATKVARSKQARIIGFTGRGGGQLKALCDECLCADHVSSDRIQETHALAYHLLCEAIDLHFASAQRVNPEM